MNHVAHHACMKASLNAASSFAKFSAIDRKDESFVKEMSDVNIITGCRFSPGATGGPVGTSAPALV